MLRDAPARDRNHADGRDRRARAGLPGRAEPARCGVLDDRLPAVRPESTGARVIGAQLAFPQLYGTPGIVPRLVRTLRRAPLNRQEWRSGPRCALEVAAQDRGAWQPCTTLTSRRAMQPAARHPRVPSQRMRSANGGFQLRPVSESRSPSGPAAWSCATAADAGCGSTRPTATHAGIAQLLNARDLPRALTVDPVSSARSPYSEPSQRTDAYAARWPAPGLRLTGPGFLRG